MKPKILFTSVFKPLNFTVDRFSPTDQMAFRLTRGQDLFVMYEHTHLAPLHLIAQNLSSASVVLEYPSMDRFKKELEQGYDYVGLTFNICNIDQAREMCELVRQKAPKTRIVIGGYGTICSPLFSQESAWKGKTDFICDGEGISFMRRVLAEPENRAIRCQLPKIGSTLNWLNPRPIGTIGIILSGLGCTFRCHFCNTAAYTKGKYIEVMTAEQIYKAMVGYWENTPFTNSVTIYDENFIDYKDKVTELGRFLQNDKTFGLSKFNYFAFGSLSALSKYDPEELLLSGIDTLWVGVESKFSHLAKTRGLSAEEAFPLLHSIGIKTVGSWIIGEDYQTPENIKEDLDLFISLDPTFQQLSVLTVSPPLGLWKKMKRQNRIPEGMQWKDYHLYGKTFLAKHLTHEEMLTHLDDSYGRIYRENGPALMKVLEVNLNGYEWCLKSSHPLLRHEKSKYFRDRCASYYSLVKTARAHAPSARVKTRLDNLDRRYQEIFGRKSEFQEKVSDRILKKADEEMKHREEKVPEPTYEPSRRYTYAPLEERTGRRPYSVEYIGAEV
ncbi:MAG: hypothetical protein GY866_37755 [Proteobacteria bacterium]|nr:hypothetical protein [Pseudomonadota bacterium]